MPSLDALLALAALGFAATWTPGPNNMMLASSGATFGMRATAGHALGVALGFPAMMFVLALGLGEVFQTTPALREGLRWVGVALLLWLGWRIGTASRASVRSGRSRPLTFLQACLFQWVNPKAWAMAISIPATFVAGVAPFVEALICAGVMLLAGITSAPTWTGFGAALGRWLADDLRLRVFNGVMGLMLAASALYLAIAEI
jgi:threonine/homoserine/homoserine lactone efflux protein